MLVRYPARHHNPPNAWHAVFVTAYSEDFPEDAIPPDAVPAWYQSDCGRRFRPDEGCELVNLPVEGVDAELVVAGWYCGECWPDPIGD